MLLLIVVVPILSLLPLNWPNGSCEWLLSRPLALKISFWQETTRGFFLHHQSILIIYLTVLKFLIPFHSLYTKTEENGVAFSKLLLFYWFHLKFEPQPALVPVLSIFFFTWYVDVKTAVKPWLLLWEVYAEIMMVSRCFVHHLYLFFIC